MAAFVLSAPMMTPLLSLPCLPVARSGALAVAAGYAAAEFIPTGLNAVAESRHAPTARTPGRRPW